MEELVYHNFIEKNSSVVARAVLTLLRNLVQGIYGAVCLLLCL